MKRVQPASKKRSSEADRREKVSCIELAGNLLGSFQSGRADLSTNKKLLAEAVISNARRSRKRPR